APAPVNTPATPRAAVAAQPPSEPRNPRRETLVATCSASLLVFSNMNDLLLVRNRSCGHFPIGRLGWGFAVVRLLFLAGAGEDEVQMLLAAGDPLGPDDSLLVDQERKRRRVGLEPLGDGILFLGQDRKAGVGFPGPGTGLVDVGVVDHHDLVRAP